MALSEGGVVSTDAPILRTGSALGDAVEVSLQGTDVAVRDALSADFKMSAEALTSAFVSPQLATAVPLALIIIVLAIRPNGLVSLRTRQDVGS